jgi:hypothetical protein
MNTEKDQLTKTASEKLATKLDQLDPSSPEAGVYLQMLTELNTKPVVTTEDPMYTNRPRFLSP